MTKRPIHVGGDGVAQVAIGGDRLVFVCGPCAIESREHALSLAHRIATICHRADVPWIYKASHSKDARSSLNSFRGPGLSEGLEILAEIRTAVGVPVVSDVFDADSARSTGAICDMVQVPAYLCRQSSVLEAAAATGRAILLKKGQFMSPWNVANSVDKLEAAGATQILLTDRGTFFGYERLVSDFRSLSVMASTGYPTCFDATHSVQLPTSEGSVAGGEPEFILPLARAAAAYGTDAIFAEVHDRPSAALSDPASVLDLAKLPRLIEQTSALHATRRELADTCGHQDDDPSVGC